MKRLKSLGKLVFVHVFFVFVLLKIHKEQFNFSRLIYAWLFVGSLFLQIVFFSFVSALPEKKEKNSFKYLSGDWKVGLEF